MTTVGGRIKAARELAGISTKDVDRLAGLTPGVCWSVENSTGDNFQTKTIDPIARVLGLTLEHVVRGEGSTPSADQVKAAVEAARAAKASPGGEAA